MVERCYCVVEIDRKTQMINNVIQVCFSIEEATNFISNQTSNSKKYVIWPSFYDNP